VKVGNSLQREFETNLDVMKTSNFAMKASPQAFRILSDSLYKNPMLAVVRELSANAWDAHLANGNTDVPFEIHVPTELEPYFEINDFGISMDDKFMHSKYVTFFESDKDHNDEAIGGYGLGSKAPFAYADQFTVRCRLGGEERAYLLMINANSEYQIMDRGAPTPTNEPDGVRITIPVADKDKDAFKQATEQVAQFFPVKPIINIKLNEQEYSSVVAIDDRVSLKYAERNHTTKVIMGFIQYFIDWHQLTRAVGDKYYEAFRRCDIHVPINYFDITPDREGIRFSERTIEALKDLAQRAGAAVDADYEKQYKALKTNDERSRFVFGKIGLFGAKTLRDKYGDALKSSLSLPETISVVKLQMNSNGGIRAKWISHDSFEWTDIALSEGRKNKKMMLFRMDKKYPYMHYFRHFTSEQLPTYIFVGPPKDLDGWRTANGIEQFTAVPKLKIVRDKNSQKTGKLKENLSLTRHNSCGVKDQSVPWKEYRTLTEVVDEHKLVILCSSDEQAEHSSGFLNLLKELLFNLSAAAVYIPTHHNRIREAMVNDYGAVLYDDVVNNFFSLKKYFRINLDVVGEVAAYIEQRDKIRAVWKQYCAYQPYERSSYFHHCHKAKKMLNDPMIGDKHPLLQGLFNDVNSLNSRLCKFEKFMKYEGVNTFIEQVTTRSASRTRHTKYINKQLQRIQKNSGRARKRYGSWVSTLGLSLDTFANYYHDCPSRLRHEYHSFISFAFNL
jgi:hypothetical protein